MGKRFGRSDHFRRGQALAGDEWKRKSLRRGGAWLLLSKKKEGWFRRRRKKGGALEKEGTERQGERVTRDLISRVGGAGDSTSKGGGGPGEEEDRMNTQKLCYLI